jgi:hypothetical protein
MIITVSNDLAYIDEVRGYFNGFQQKVSASLRQWCAKFSPGNRWKLKCRDGARSMGGEGNRMATKMSELFLNLSGHIAQRFAERLISRYIYPFKCQICGFRISHATVGVLCSSR